MGDAPTSAVRPARSGRPPLTERRKAATRLEIAEVAVRLFSEKGVAATSADEIAAAAGVSTRTLWRYFPTKEACVQPLLAVGVDALAEALRHSSGREPLIDVLETMRPEAMRPTAGSADVLSLVRLTRTEPGLRSVWLQTHLEAESVLAEALAERSEESPDALAPRVAAAVINVALRVAAEEYAWKPERSDRTLDEVARAALRIAADALRQGSRTA
ncbi:TetR/AcrR family transcriptional regulator [Streptomyces sp. AM 2-1-1]|uniref:TetR/AcrR family transcriptional regulator n=1 Tax=Streptomyces sp. AM 2-1-1 TaxID=3028709 RepID=UPI0023B982FF|nr:TetR/AcrR family transcriptional regulator [Streptomyces sp. AM 2-1-1]WEH40527.1 helix-turn-helix domain containing protein [Streptomyces sp. AM 2-1-1]